MFQQNDYGYLKEGVTNVYWNKLLTQHGFWRTFFYINFIYINKIKSKIIDNTVCHAWTSTGLLDENQKSCWTWNWWVLFGKHMYHSTVHWLSLDNAIIKIII